MTHTDTDRQTVVVPNFPPHHGWMSMTCDQLMRSLNWLHGEIRHSVMRELSTGELRPGPAQKTIIAFVGCKLVMWTHRCIKQPDHSYLAEYQVCEVGKPDKAIVTGELTFMTA